MFTRSTPISVSKNIGKKVVLGNRTILAKVPKFAGPDDVVNALKQAGFSIDLSAQEVLGQITHTQVEQKEVIVINASSHALSKVKLLQVYDYVQNTLFLELCEPMAGLVYALNNSQSLLRGSYFVGMTPLPLRGFHFIFVISMSERGKWFTIMPVDSSYNFCRLADRWLFSVPKL